MDIKKLVYIDTNVYLDFYQSSKDRLAVFNELVDRASYIVMPEQTKREFQRNRKARLTELARKVRDSGKVNLFTTAIVREVPEFADWQKARDAAGQTHLKG